MYATRYNMTKNNKKFRFFIAFRSLIYVISSPREILNLFRLSWYLFSLSFILKIILGLIFIMPYANNYVSFFTLFLAIIKKTENKF